MPEIGGGNIKYFPLEDSKRPGIAKVQIISSNAVTSTVRVVEIVRKSEFR